MLPATLLLAILAGSPLATAFPGALVPRAVARQNVGKAAAQLISELVKLLGAGSEAGGKSFPDDTNAWVSTVYNIVEQPCLPSLPGLQDYKANLLGIHGNHRRG